MRSLRRTPLVRASYKELLEFVRFYRHHGTPVIIGGWAVYFYNPYFGSVDVDVVGHSYGGTFEEIIERYERTHGYEFDTTPGLVEMTARKPIISKGKLAGHMEIDACSYERPGASRFHEDESLELPYSAIEDRGCKKEVRLTKDTVFYVPCKELLLLYKVKARRDRAFDIRARGATIGGERLQWLRGKVVKDGADILALLDPRAKDAQLPDAMSYQKLRRLARKHHMSKVVARTVGDILEDEQASRSYGRRFNSSGIRKAVSLMR